MIHVLKFAGAKTLGAVIALVVAVGIAVGAMRLLLPLVAEYREQLAAALGQHLGQPVHIGGLGARLAGLSPELTIADLELLDPADGSVQWRCDQVRLRLDTLGSIAERALRVGAVTVVGVRLLIRRQADGRLAVAGFGGQSGGDGNSLSPAMLLAQGRLRLERGEILWENRRLGMPPLWLTGVEAQLLNAGDRHRLDLSAAVFGVAGGLQLAADLTGDPAAPADWSGELYLGVENVDLAQMAGLLQSEDDSLRGNLDARLWSRWRGGRLQNLVGDGRARDPAWSVDGKRDRLAEEMSARVALVRETDGWRLDVADLQLKGDGRAAAAADLAVRYQERPQRHRVSLALSGISLDRLDAAMNHLSLADSVREAWHALNPRGQVRDLRMQWDTPALGEPQWRLAGRVEGLRTDPVGDAPGVDGLSIDFRADREHGELELAGRAVELRFTRLFRWPWRNNQVQGTLGWRLPAAGGIELRGDDIHLSNPDLTTRSRLLLRIGADGQAPFIDLQSDYVGGTASATPKYLPVSIMDPDLVAWLDRAIVSGRVPSGSFVLRGAADRFPYFERDGRFQVLFGVEDTVLDYQDGWPRLEEIVAEVEFLNEGLQIELDEGKLLSSDVTAAHMRLPDMIHAQQVFIDGEVRGPFSDGFRILRETPLAAHQARYVQGMSARGSSRVDLDLAIPVEPGAALRVNGRAHWDKATLLLDDWNLALKQLQGELRFTTEGVYAENLQARLWDDPVRVGVDSYPASGGRPSGTRIDVDLQLDPQRLGGHWPHWIWGELTGSAPARLRLEVEHAAAAHKELPLSFRFESALEGLEIHLPEPLAKSAPSPRRLFLNGMLPAADGSRFDAGYGDLLGGFVLKADAAGALRLGAGEIVAAASAPPAAANPGFLLRGRFERVDVGAWLDWLDRHRQVLAADGDGLRMPSQRVDLQIGKLQLADWQIEDLHFGMVRTPSAWELELDSAKLAGSVRVPDDYRQSPLSAQLTRVRLDPPAADAAAAPEPVSGDPSALDPARAPGLFLDLEQLYLGENLLGAVKIKAAPVAGGLRLDELALSGGPLDLNGSGWWTRLDGAARSELEVKGRAGDVGAALRALQFKSPLSKAPLEFTTRLSWPGGPLDATAGNLDGTLDFRIGKGRVLDVDPGVGRLFGLFNLWALSRRLSLDFSDLFGKGYAFDRIEGGFRLEAGNARSDAIEIAGPSVDMKISGRTGLIAGDYDQTVEVTPELSSALPVAGVLAGGPVVGAALLLAQGIMGDEMNKLGRVEYRVTGPWTDPEITRVEKQDSDVRADLPARSADQVLGEL